MIDSWILFAILSSFLHALMPLAHEFFQQKSINTLFWMRATAIILLTPFVFLIPIPKDLYFFIFGGIASFLFAWSDVYKFGMSGKNGAGVVSRIAPLSSGLTFVIWTLITPSLLISYINEPARFMGIIISIIFAIYFALKLKKCAISYETLKIIAPAIIMSSLGIILSKTAMNHTSDMLPAIFYYAYFQSIIVFLIYSFAMNINAVKTRIPDFDAKHVILFSKTAIISGACISLIHLSAISAKYSGVYQVENPAYITLVELTAPLWILLIYRIFGRKEKADIKSGLGIIASIALLLIFAKL